MRLILASQSPRRRELLAQAGFEFTVEPSRVDEAFLPGEAAAAYVERLAIEKAQEAAGRLRAVGAGDSLDVPDAETVVLGADTVVVLADGAVLGKPVDAAQARSMLAQLSGRTHAVMTGVAAVCGQRTLSDVEITQVTFNVLMPEEIDAYVGSGEPLDKAGAYGIQGYAARWIPRIEGDYGNVVGLPLARVVALVAAVVADTA